MKGETSTLHAATIAVREGKAVVPVPTGEKGPVLTGWTTLRLAEADLPDFFGNGENLGLILGAPSNGLIDIDLDAQESLALASEFLPSTSRRHGRASKPDSHWWYVATPTPRPTKYADIDGTCLVELRSTGQQTIIPPSLHPSRERIAWSANGDPASVEASTLERAVAQLAAAVILVRHWPKKGSRHDCVLPLAGLLLRGGWSADEAERFVGTVVRATGDEEARSRLKDVQSTAVKLANGSAVTGGRTLAKLVGEDVVAKLREWLHLSPSSHSRIVVASPLQNAVRSVILDKEVSAFDKRRHVADLVATGLRECGEFYRTADGRAFFFSHAERTLLDLEQRQFQHLLTTFTGLSAKEGFFTFTLDVLQATTSRQAPLVQVHTLASFDSSTGLLATSDGGGGIWFRERLGKWEQGHNGDHGLLFLTEAEATPWVPEFGANGRALEWYLNQFLFGHHPLSREDQQTLLQMWLFQQFFPPLRRTRLTPACLGPHGSGKTTGGRLIGRLLLGPAFDVSGIHRDREDAFMAAVTNRVLFGLDNADSRIPWLEDALARYATGERYRLRRLYTTNDEVSYTPRAILMLSSRDPQFNRPDVAERLLPLYFERPARYIAEDTIYAGLETRRGAIMGAVLTRLGEIADGLAEVKAPPLAFRMADFAAFGWRVSVGIGASAEWEKLLRRLEGAQVRFASEGEGTVIALRELLQRDKSLEGVSVGDLFRRCRALAEEQGILFPRTAQVFGRRISSLRRVIELELGVRMQEETGHGGVRWVTLTPRPGDKGDDGDDVRAKVEAGVGE